MYNHPSVDDDFCFAYMTRDYGFWKAQRLYYEGWSGRYISNMIFHATPLAFGNFWFVKLMPFLIFGFLFHAIYTLIGEVLKQPQPLSVSSQPLSVSSQTTATSSLPLSVFSQMTLTITFLSIFIIFSPSIIDTFYWYSSVFIFPTSFGFFLYLIVVLLRFYQPHYQRIKYLISLLAATLVFLIVGSNEVMMLFIIGFLGIIWGYMLLFQKRFDVFIFTLMLIGLYFAYFWVVQAKGNQIRLVGGNVLGGAIVLSLTNALKSTVFDGLKWSLILSPFAYLYISSLPEKESVKAIFKANVWIVSLGLFTLLFMMFFVIHYGNDMGVPDRVKNVIFEVFLIGYFYIFTIIKYSYSVNYKLKPSLINYGIGALIISFFIFRYGQNLQIMYADIRLGIAKRYDQEMTQRYTKIRESKSDTVYVAPLKNVPKSLCFDDIKTTEKHLWNKCYATYFEKKVIILAPQPPEGE